MPPFTKFQPPPVVTGYPIDYKIDLVVPLGADITNIHTNPSIELNTTGFAAAAGSAISQNSSFQRRGAYSLRCIPTSNTGDGIYTDAGLTLLVSTEYSISFDVWGVKGVPYKVQVMTSAGAAIAGARVLKFVGKGYWERIQFFYEELTGAARRLYIVKDGSADTNSFYLDGFSVIAQPYRMKYFDGDTPGYTPSRQEFYWTGTPHASTSVMIAQTRAGGKLVPLSNYGITVLAILGLGMNPVTNLSQRMALTGGALFNRSVRPPRSFSLVGFISAENRSRLEGFIAQLTYDLEPSRVPYDQPLVLQYQPVDDCNNPAGNTVDIVCQYSGGLEGNRDNYQRANVDLKFDIFAPYAASMDGSEGGTVNSRTSIANSGYVMYRTPAGVWKAAQAGLNGQVYAIIKMPDGRYLVGGAFTDAGGDTNADKLAYYNPITDTFSAPTTAALLNNTVRALALLPNGMVAVGGDFTVTGTRPQFLRILDPATNTFINMTNNTDMTGPVFALEVLPTGHLAVGGNFTNVANGGVAIPDADYLAKLLYISPFTYSAFSTTVLNAPVRTLALGLNNNLWIGGDFTNVAGKADQDYLTMMTSPYTTFSELLGSATPLNNNVINITSLTSGDLLVGGGFTDVNGDTTWDRLFITGPMLFNLTTLQMTFARLKLFSNINASTLAMAEVTPGTNMVGGMFSSVNGLTLFDHVFQFSGNTIVPMDVDLPGVAEVTAIAGSGLEAMLGFDTTGTGYTSGTTTLTNSGSSDAYPIIVVKYSAAATVVAPLYSIRNLTTGQVISFNVSLLPGETVVFDFRPGKKTITSISGGRGHLPTFNMIAYMLPGSNLSTFKLQPGPNVLNLFVDLAAASNITAYAWWQPTYSGIESVVRR